MSGSRNIGLSAVAAGVAVVAVVAGVSWALLRPGHSPSVPERAPAAEAARSTGGTAGSVAAASGGRESPAGAGEVTFNRDLASVIHRQCSPCHRPGEAGPFSLLTYADVRAHAADLVEVTRTRYMPPWLPEPGEYPLQDERRLTAEEITRFKTWFDSGMPEGRPEDRPPMPTWTEGWQLGPPDLVVTLPEAYTVPAEGRDVYRNFVIPVPTSARRFVRAFEFRPGTKAVHHAFLRIDASREARKLDAREEGPGFGGMDLPPSAESPAGHFLGWQPGRMPTTLPDGLSWVLPAGADVVLLAHLQPLGRPERLQPSIGFYFTDVPPTNSPLKLGLRSYTLDLPAGASNVVVEERVTLPVDTQLHAVLPHAHYLGRLLEGWAEFPGGTRKALLRIPEWDFNWQSEYRFVHPVALPRGTTLAMRFTYDNSAANVRNPHQPPKRVTFGLQTTDEMAELWFQLTASTAAEYEALSRTCRERTVRDIAELSRFKLRQDPADAEAMSELGKVELTAGNAAAAEAWFRRALEVRPNLEDAHYHLGLVHLGLGRVAEAEAEFLEAIRLNPEHFQARGNAGLCAMRLGRLDEAAAHFREVLRLRPGDTVARKNLELVEQARRR